MKNKISKRKLFIIEIIILLVIVVNIGIIIGNVLYSHKGKDNSNNKTENIKVSKKQEFTVFLDYGNGTDIVSNIVEENSVFIKPEDPIMDGYLFSGWYLNDELFDFSSPITSDITLVAKWEIISSENNTNDSVTSSTDNNKKTTDKSSSSSNKSSNSKSNSSSDTKNNNQSSNDNQSIKAVHVIINNSCFGKEFTKSDNSMPADNTKTLDSITKNYEYCENYDFLGWYINDEKINPSDYTLDNDISVTAKWQERMHTIYFNTNGGSYVAPITFSEKGTYLSEPTTTKDGYTFIKWNQEDGQQFDFFNKVAGFTRDQYLTAEWSKIITTRIDKYETGMRISTGRFAFSVCTSEVFLASTYSSTNAEIYLYTSDSENGKYFSYGPSNEKLNIGDDGGSYAVRYLENNPNYVKIRIHDNNSDLDVITPPMKVSDYNRC